MVFTETETGLFQNDGEPDTVSSDGLLPCEAFSGTKIGHLELETRSFSVLLPLFIPEGTAHICPAS